MRGLIIALVLILIILIIIIVLVWRVKKKVREFSSAILGTPDIKEGLRQAEYEISSTPKSVSGMTSLYLPKIIKDFPDFSYDEMKPKAENAVTSYLLAINSKAPGLLQEGNSELKNKLENRINDVNSKGLTEHFEDIKIHRTEISNYRKISGRCIITFQTSLEYLHYATNDSGTITGGNDNTKVQTRYESDLIYIQDRSIAENDEDGVLGLNCPNCGAPITSLGSKVCPYCGTPIVELNIHAWSFSEVREK